MKVIRTASDAEALALQAAIDSAMGYPRKGVHVGEGRHIDIPESWDGNGNPPPGWSAHYAEIYHAETRTPIIPFDDGDATRLVPRINVLGQQERAAVSDALGRRAEANIEAEGYQPRARTVSDAGVRR